MNFLSADECEQWLRERSLVLPGVNGVKPAIRIWFPKSPFAFYSWAQTIANSIALDQPCLFWIREWGVWQSSDNWSLYEHLRKGYGDSAALDEKPGHLFTGDENDDLATYLQLSMMFGWGGYLLTETSLANAFISHDEFVDVFSTDNQMIANLGSTFDRFANTARL